MQNKCIICKRKLRNIRSMTDGVGSVCKKKLKGNQMQIFEINSFSEIKKIKPIPKDKLFDVILSRDGLKASVNVPRRIIYHSPSGFEFGYGGAGPADLSLNILSMYVGGEKALELHQDFKSKFIATLDNKGGIISKNVIIKYLTSKGYYETA